MPTTDSTQFEETFDNPKIQQEYAGYHLHGDVASMRDLLEKCENPVALAEATMQLDEVVEELQLLSAHTKARITRLYFPQPLVDVA